MSDKANRIKDEQIRSFDDYLATFFPEELRRTRLRSTDPEVVAEQISKDAVDRVKARLAASS